MAQHPLLKASDRVRIQKNNAQRELDEAHIVVREKQAALWAVSQALDNIEGCITKAIEDGKPESEF